MIYWESLTNWSLAMNLGDLAASIPFPLTKWKTTEVETFFSSSQGSRIVNIEKSSIVLHSWSVLVTFEFSTIKQGSTPRIDQSFMLRSSVLLSQAWSVVHQAFLVLLPITVDYLDRWAYRHQYHDHTSPWRRSTLDFCNRIHDVMIAWADLVELRVVYTR
jgi:hypothetical protein